MSSNVFSFSKMLQEQDEKEKSLQIQEKAGGKQETPMPTQPTQPAHPSHPIPVSPAKDFTKVANSLFRESSELFKGMSRHTYDALYKRTRGAIVPTRKVQLTKAELCDLTGLNNNTVFKHITHLKKVGLVKVEYAFGNHGGSIYEVMVPDEIKPIPSHTSLPSLPSLPNPTQPTQKVVPHPYQKEEWDGMGNMFENKEVSGNVKPLIKTKEEKRIDDEPAAALNGFSEKINDVFKQLMGREMKESDADALTAIGELLAAEILEAASRTKVVSDAAKFSLTHLRRRLGVRTIKVETSFDKETGKGTASTKPVKREIQLSDDEIQECPDCQGRLLIYPGGPGKGAVMCKHSQLTKAEQAENQKGIQENKREGK
jgi:hypothetical protein